MHEAVTLWPPFEFLSCRVCVALPLFMEAACLLLMEGGKNSSEGVYGGDTHPGNIHAWPLSWLTPLTSMQLLNPAGTHVARKHVSGVGANQKPVQFTAWK